MRSFVLACLCLLTTTTANAETLTVATWNIYWLSDHKNNKRSDEDYARLRTIVGKLNADIIALQEVDDGLVQRVFDPMLYNIELSGRTSSTQKTALAIRKALAYERKADYEALDVGDVRYGTLVEMRIGDMKIDVMSVHMKSGCFSKSEENSSDPKKQKACTKLHRQIPILETWADDHISAGKPFVLLGDFNRRLAQRDDKMWQDLSDGKPMPLTLATSGEKPQCWEGFFKQYIDHIILGPTSSKWIVPNSFSEFVFVEARTSNRSKRQKWSKLISDHCPISLTLNIR